MPIAFPLPRRGALIYDPKQMFRKPFYVEPVPNLGQPGMAVSAKVAGVSMARQKQRNGRNLGSVYKAAAANSYANQVGKPLTDKIVWHRVMAGDDANRTLSGVSRDSAGAALGACQVLVFRTEDKSFVAETVSDAGGVWALSMMKGGPFFYVQYKAGSPDVAGTSVNTLTVV